MSYNSANNVSLESNEFAYVNLTAGTAIVKSGRGVLGNIIINSHSSGTLKIRDGLNGVAGLICNTMSFTVGERIVQLNGLVFGTGCYVEIGGTADLTIQYK